MQTSWSKLFQSFIYLLLAIILIFIQTLIPTTPKGVLFSLFLLLGTIISSILFAAKTIASVTTPHGQPYPIISAFATVTAIILIIFEIYLSVKLIIEFIILIFPK